MSLAAALTPDGGLDIEYIDGVTEVLDNALPPGDKDKERKMGKGTVGAWRAHINALRTIVEQNITSALIIEGDIDWDLRIKTQMQDFAKASRLLVQPGLEDKIFDISDKPLSELKTSPYGDTDLWDILWLGHCGTEMVDPEKNKAKVHTGRVVISNDETVPEPQHVKIEYGTDQLVKQYPAHTRVVHRTRMNVCSLAYGVSQQGARKFLYELGIRKLNEAMDLMMRAMCDGFGGRAQHNCLTVEPQLFQHHRPVGSKKTFSEIAEHGDGYNEVAFTRNIRWSTRLNFRKLVDGETDYIDLFQDGQPAQDLGFG